MTRSLLCCGLLAVCSSLSAQDIWDQWRGPTRDGVSVGPDWPSKFSDKTFVEKWKLPDLGPSYSGPIVSADRVFTTETIDKKYEVVRCLDRATGKELWRKQWDGSMAVPFFAAKNGSWIRSTPATDGENLYVGGIRDSFFCLDAKTGAEKWKFDFMAEFSSALPAFGCVCSPLVDETGLYVQAGGCFAKLDKKTGKPIWKTLEEKDAMMGSAFASPAFAKLLGRDQVLVQTRSRLAGVDKQSGAILWQKEIPSFRGMNILTPVTFGEGVFTSTYGGNTRLVSLKKDGDKVTTDDAWGFKYEGNMTTPVVVDGHAYFLGRDRRAICVDLKTGKETWRTEKRFGEYWNLVVRKDKILALDQTGMLYLLKVNPKEFELLDEKKVAKAETWAHLAVAGSDVVIRDLNGMSVYTFKE